MGDISQFSVYVFMSVCASVGVDVISVNITRSDMYSHFKRWERGVVKASDIRVSRTKSCDCLPLHENCDYIIYII